MNRIVINDVRDIDLEHIFECGQCFRWVPAGDGSGDYTGAAGRYAARVSLRPAAPSVSTHDAAEDNVQNAGKYRLMIEATGGDEAFWSDYFDLGTDYGAIKDELVRNEPEIENAVYYGYGIRILRQDIFETLISFIVSQGESGSI
jgi:N-glycosylase/DNA lyase